MSASIAVVIPAYGLMSLTHSVVGQCSLEDVAQAVVVDNMGGYEPVSDEVVVTPQKNTGWLGGTNLGFELARSRGFKYLVSLNNDTRVSANFFRGLYDAAEASDRLGVLSTVYDDVNLGQRYFEGPAEGFVPEKIEYELPRVDGTCFLMPSSVYDDLGALDARYFGRRGWGAIEDLCLRVRRAGLRVVVTRRSYLTHARGSTANSSQTAYERYAIAEFRRGMRRKWGSDWRELFPGEDLGAPSSMDKLRDSMRNFEDRVGLSNTWIGRPRPKPE